MEEAGQDVPSWLRAEADRFSKHEVQGSFEGVLVSSYVCAICQTGSNELVARVVFCTNMSIATQARQKEEGRGGGDARGGGRSGGSGCFKCGEEVGCII